MSTVADRYSTPIFDQLKTEMPELDIPASPGLTYEECVEHAKPSPEPKDEEEDGT